MNMSMVFGRHLHVIICEFPTEAPFKSEFTHEKVRDLKGCHKKSVWNHHLFIFRLCLRALCTFHLS